MPLDGHRLGTAGPQRVDHRLDVLLVDDQRIVGDARGLHVRGGIGERDPQAGSGEIGQARRLLRDRQALGELTSARLAAGKSAHLVGQRRDVTPQLLVARRLGDDQVAHVGGAVAAEIRAARGEGGNGHHQAREHAHQHGGHAPAKRSVPGLVAPDVLADALGPPPDPVAYAHAFRLIAGP